MLNDLLKQLTVADVMQMGLLLIAIVTVINSYGSRIKSLEKSQTKQEVTCATAMTAVVTKQLLNAKLEGIRAEINHLNSGQEALFSKMEKVHSDLTAVLLKGNQ